MGKRVKILRETMKIAEEGCYFAEGQEVKLPFEFSRIKAVKLYSPNQTAALLDTLPELPAGESETSVSLCNQETLEAAFSLNTKRLPGEKPVLVLNFANPHRPGGGIRARPGTQEEHLCVKTTLLSSLETEEAWPFYQKNLDCGTQAQTDSILFTPNTVVIRNSDLTLRADPFPIAVMTVSAPIAARMEPEELPELEKILSRRIRGMLRVAVMEGYTRLVLGAWGCGNFGNDPALVAKLFYEALQENLGGRALLAHFTDVVMAVMDLSEERIRYRAFEVYFSEAERK